MLVRCCGSEVKSDYGFARSVEKNLPCAGHRGMNVGVQSQTPGCCQVETKFIRAAQALPLGSWRDGWLVVWCQPDRQRVLWHVMLLRTRIEFRGCCD